MRKRLFNLLFLGLLIAAGTFLYAVHKHISSSLFQKEQNPILNIKEEALPPSTLFQKEQKPKLNIKENPTGYYKALPGIPPLNPNCSTCAFVTSSGHLLDSKLGQEIDAHQCVIRTNDSPTTAFAQDVGLKTTYRIFGFPGRYLLVKRLENGEIHESEQNGGSIVAWGPPRMMGDGHPYTELLKGLQNKYTSMYFYEYTNLSWGYEVYNDIRHTKADPEMIWLSTGYFAMLFARQFCGMINLYGMVDADYCNRKTDMEGDAKPYHYYGKGVNDECDIVRQQATSKFGGHQFAIEKRIIQNWAKEEKNIFFKWP